MPQMVHVTTKQKENLGLTSPSASELQWAEAKLLEVIGHLTNNLIFIGTSPKLTHYGLNLVLISSLIKPSSLLYVCVYGFYTKMLYFWF